MNEQPKLDSGPVLYAGTTMPTPALYIHRSADAELYHELSRGQYCVVLGPNQIGKSTLAQRTQRRLESAGVRCANVDMSVFGLSESTSEPQTVQAVRRDSWYDALISRLAHKLNLDDLDPYMSESSKAPPTDRLARFFETVVARIDAPVVLFFDEIQTIQTVGRLGMLAGEFFTTLRSVWNARIDNTAIQRLSFCLLGVMSPAELSSDPKEPPFGFATRIRLEDFSEKEMEGFASIVASALGCPAEPFLQEVFRWTEGHPYMTQFLLREICAQPPGPNADVAATVTERVERCFLDRRDQRDGTFLYATNWFKGRHEHDAIAHENKVLQIDLYRRLLNNEEIVAEVNNPNHARLVITGMVAERHRKDGPPLLKVRNRIFASIFDFPWVHHQQTDRQLALAVTHWISSGRLPQHLYRGSTLKIAREWAERRSDLEPDESRFIMASMEEEAAAAAKQAQAEAEVAAQQARQRSLRILRTVLGIIVLVFAGIGYYSVVKTRELRHQTQLTNCLSSDTHACQELATELERNCRNGPPFDPCFHVASMYQRGDGLPKDELRARELFDIGCRGNNGPSCNELGRLREHSLNFEGAYELYERSCGLGYGLGCSNQGYLLEKGRGVAGDRERALNLYQRACEASFAEGCNNLGWIHLAQAERDPSSFEPAKRNLVAACGMNYGLACLNLGFLYERYQPLLAVRDAPMLYRKACDLNEAEGCTHLAFLLRKSGDNVQALRFYQLGCDRGDARGCSNAGFLIENGVGTAKDPILAGLYYLRGCEREKPYELACKNLASLFKGGSGFEASPERSKYFMNRAKQ